MTEAATIDNEDLPQLIAEIRDVIGLPAALELVGAYGGTVVHVPETFDPEHPLVAVLGHRAGSQLVHHFAREHIYIAKCEAAIREQRNREIIARYDGGTPVPTLAREYGLSVRQIWNILARREGDSSTQSDLFNPSD